MSSLTSGNAWALRLASWHFYLSMDTAPRPVGYEWELLFRRGQDAPDWHVTPSVVMKAQLERNTERSFWPLVSAVLSPCKSKATDKAGVLRGLNTASSLVLCMRTARKE